MLALVLAAALIAQVTHGAPSNCGDLCEQGNGSYGKSWGSHSSYSTQSSYGSQSSYSSGSKGLGRVGARIEDLDENAVINTGGLDRPGSWRDEKHYVTDDGKGQMNYKAGQSVSNNGYSKWASHSYSYGSHDSHAPLSNSQVLTTSQFNNELQNIRTRIANFMGNFNLGSSSHINVNFLEDFKNKASLISNQLNDVCSHIDVGSASYQQMQQEIEEFQRQVDQRQRQIEASIFQTTSSSSTSYYPQISTNPAPIMRPDNTGYVQQQQQHVDEEISKIQSQINGFYTTFNRVDSDIKFQEDLNSQVNVLTQKLVDLAMQAEQNQSQRQRIENIKNQYESYVSSIRERIQEMVRRNQEEDIKRQQRLQEIENERLKLEQEEKERVLQLRLEEERLRQQEQEAERQRIATERKRQEQEAENRRRLQALENERIRIRNEEQKAAETKRQSESLQLQLNQQQQQLNNLHSIQTMRPHVSGSVHVSGSSSIHQSMTGSYGSTGGDVTTGAYVKPQPVVLQPHVDVTAAVNRLQQELNRVQSEVNKFNSYRMRLTADNSASIANEAKLKYDQLLQNLENICETSNTYNNQNILNNAQELQRHFEKLYDNFKHQVETYASSNFQGSVSGGFSSSSSYGSSGSYQHVKQPKISNVDITHEKSTEIEIGSSRGPVRSYSSGSGYSQSSGYKSYGAGSDNKFRSGVIDLGYGADSSDTDCVEQQAGQPCLLPARRYRRSVGDYGPIYDQPEYVQHPQDYRQKYVLPSLDDFQSTGEVEFSQTSQPLRNSQYSRRSGSQSADLTIQQGDIDDHYGGIQLEHEGLNQQHVNHAQNEELDSLQNSRNQDVDVFTPRSLDHVQSRSSQHSGEHSLDKSEFNNNNNPTEKLPKAQHGPAHQECGDVTLQKCRLNDYSIDTVDKPQLVNPIRRYEQSGTHENLRPTSENLQLSQQTEDLPQQQNFANPTSRNEKIDIFDDFGVTGLTQQTTSDVEFGPESQSRRLHQSEHSTEPLTEQSSQPQQSLNKIEQTGSDYYNRPIESANSQSERNYGNTENQEHLSTIRPIVKPAPKPIPRYSRPWQVNNVNNKPKQIETELRSNENQDASIERSSTPKSVKPLRGDLPGQSESSTTESSAFYNNIPVTSQKPTTTRKPEDVSGLGQQYESVDLNINNKSDGLQISRNDWISGKNENNEFGQSGTAYHFNQHHSFHHNFSYTHNSNYYNHQNSNFELGQTVQSPLSQQNNEFEPQSRTFGSDLNQQSIYRFHEKQLSHSKFEQSSSPNNDFKVENIGNSHLLESRSQNVFDQQTQLPSLDQSSQNEFGQQEMQQRTEDLLASGVIPIDDKRPSNTWEDGTVSVSSTTISPTFWKKIGQKITNSYDKAKEKAKNIFG